MQTFHKITCSTPNYDVITFYDKKLPALMVGISEKIIAAKQCRSGKNYDGPKSLHYRTSNL